MKATFIISAADYVQFPSTTLPEVCFAGRSNVGKSSMINKILNQKSLVKVGNTPGKTRLINFFNIDDEYIFTDLPGYGYAQVSKKERENWAKLIEKYFNIRRQLKLCVLLLDCRRDPNDDDIFMLKAMQSLGIKTIVTITKTDKLSNNQLFNQMKKISEKVNIDKSLLIPFSINNINGKNKLWEEIRLIKSDENI